MILVLLSCVNTSLDLSETKVESNATSSLTLSPKETVKIAFFDASSPLQRPEISLEQWPETIVQSLSNADKVIGVSNLLRATCLEEYQRGFSLAESIVAGTCLKSFEWVNFIDERLDLVSVDDFLFQYAISGPYWGNHLNGIDVFIRVNAPEMSLVLQRIHQLQTTVTVIQHQESKMLSILECNGQNMSEDDGFDINKCDTIDVNDDRLTVYRSLLSSDYSTSSPVWMLNGYLVRGVQSARMLQHYLQYP